MAEDGTVAAEAARPSRFLNPGPDMQEQDAKEWWANTVEIFRQITEQAGEDVVKRIRGIFHQFPYSHATAGGRTGKTASQCDYLSGWALCQ